MTLLCRAAKTRGGVRYPSPSSRQGPYLNPGTRLLPLTGPHRQAPSHPLGQSTAAWAVKGALDKGSESTKKWAWGPKGPSSRTLG